MYGILRGREGYPSPSTIRATFPPDLFFFGSVFFCVRRCKSPERRFDIPYHRE
jgi:hypothetical protein